MNIHVIGIGPGNPEYLTADAAKTISERHALIGVSRQLEGVAAHVSDTCEMTAYSGRLDELKSKVLDAFTRYDDIGILASGDPSFYGITKWLGETFKEARLHIHPGISSTQILFAKTNTPMHDFFMTSLHGRTDALSQLLNYPKVCLLTDRIYTPFAIAEFFQANGQNPRMIIGESLSYADECITDALASEVEDRDYKMSVVIVIHER